jgi:hypothetical protein
MALKYYCSLLVPLLLVSGCTHARKLTSDGHESHYTIDCRYLSRCYDKAAQVCGEKSYALIDKDGTAVSGTGGLKGQYESVVGHRTTILVRCANP